MQPRYLSSAITLALISAAPALAALLFLADIWLLYVGKASRLWTYGADRTAYGAKRTAYGGQSRTGGVEWVANAGGAKAGSPMGIKRGSSEMYFVFFVFVVFS